MIALRLASSTTTVHAGVLASGTSATRRVHEIRMAHAPLQHLHAAHRGADHRDDVVDAEVVHQLLLRGHHVADQEFREFHARLRGGVRRRGGQPVADRVGADDEVLVGVERLAGADQEIEAVMIAADGGDHQDRVRFLLVELAVRDVGDREVLDDFAGLELEIADLVGLMRRLVRRVRQSRRCGERRREREDPQDCEHRRLPIFVIGRLSGGTRARDHDFARVVETRTAYPAVTSTVTSPSMTRLALSRSRSFSQAAITSGRPDAGESYRAVLRHPTDRGREIPAGSRTMRPSVTIRVAIASPSPRA